MNLNNIAQLFGASPVAEIPVLAVSIDSRQIKPGYLFLALSGERLNGHDFIAEAVARGAIAVVCEQAADNIPVPQFIVPDSIKALASLAAFHRQTIKCPVIALTGSNGKTTVKEMIAAILPQPSHATPGNFNNHIGAPLSVLQLEDRHRYAVFELGANHPGEIAFTAAVVKPQVTLINNIAPAHIEGFGSIEGVAKAKGEIYEVLTAEGTAIVNDDDEFAHFWDKLLVGKKVLRFSLTGTTPLHARGLSYDEKGRASFTLVLPSGEALVRMQVPGEHTVRNALAAAACCYAVGIDLADIVQGLEKFAGVAGRMTWLQGKNHCIVIDDTYNANLRSVLTAVAVLAKLQGKRILVLGDMGELGAWTQKHHEEVGLVARSQGIDLLMTCGKHSAFTSQAFGAEARHYAGQEELTRDLLTRLDSNTTVLVKGSRSAAMEKIVHQLAG